jgi:rubrerythrin
MRKNIIILVLKNNLHRQPGKRGVKTPTLAKIQLIIYIFDIILMSIIKGEGSVHMEFIKIEDVFEVAVRIERKGIEYYKLAHEKAAGGAAKDVFAFLVSQEEKHLGTFQGLLEKAADYQPRFKYPGYYEAFYNDAASQALESLKRVDAVLAAKSTDDALGLARNIEAESIAYYQAMLKAFPDEKDHKVIQRIVDEEKAHLAKIASLGTKGLKF